MNSLLRRQLKKHVEDGTLVGEEPQPFLDAVDKAYNQFDDDRILLERSLDISSAELLDANTKLRADHALLEEMVKARTSALLTANETLRTSEERFRSVIQSANDAIVLADSAGSIIGWNRAGERIFGFSEEEILGKPITILMSEEYREKHLKGMAHYQATGEGRLIGKTVEIEGLRKDGGKFPIDISLVSWKSGEQSFFSATIRDIAERKNIEAQLMRAQRMESIGTLAGGIAHDLNNILTPILMSIDMLRASSGAIPEAEAEKILATIEASAQRGADIVHQVLAFARGMEGRRAEIRPQDLLKDISQIVSETFPKNIRLKLSAPPEAWSLQADPTQIHQMLLNLCVNSRDAMPEGGLLSIGIENRLFDEHYVSMNPQARTGPHLLLSVTDTGTGIPKDILEKIFDPFFTTKEIGKGTGLGLSTTLAIVKSHNGFIHVESEQGHGTTFRIHLPALMASGQPRTPESTGAGTRTAASGLPRGNGETILVIDDELSILTISSKTLQMFNYRVLTASNGAEGVATYATHRNEIAAVLTDMAMPIMDGPATIRALTQMNPDVKIIAMSGYHIEANGSKEGPHGIRRFLAKPYTAETLLKTLNETLHLPATN